MPTEQEWEAIYRDEAAKKMIVFERAAKRVDAQLKKIATGETALQQAVWRAIDRLHKIRNLPEIRGREDARAKADERIEAVRAALRLAVERGEAATRSARDAQIRTLEDERKERERGLSGYEKELRLMANRRR